jgi:hypothetical protein
MSIAGLKPAAPGFTAQMGIPAKPNAESGMIPNGIPG